MIAYMQKRIINDLRSEFNEYISADADNLVDVFEELYAKTKKQFIFIIDEWDCIFRELKDDTELQKSYLDFLRDLFKGQPYTALVYMTGILPIKKIRHSLGFEYVRRVFYDRYVRAWQLYRLYSR